jgi:hypothetical protein
MNEAEIKAIVDKLADVARVLHEADPADKAEVFRHTRHQAVLIYVNAHDHLLTLGRIRFRHRAGAGAGPAASSAAAGPSRQHAPRVLRK